MSKQPSLLPKIEILIVGVLFLVFLIWSISKCSSTRRQLAEREAAEAREQARLDSIDGLKAGAAEGFVPLDTAVRPIKKPAPEKATERFTPLYVITPALNMRTGPGLKFKILERLQLHDELLFLGEVTDTTQQIDLGEIVTDEPWVKVRTSKGKEGWVYGACVDFYKRKLSGVEVD